MTHPYADLPDRAFWRRAVAEAGDTLLPVAEPFLRLSRDDRVMTAGSCFAQHIGRSLHAAGFNHLVTEQPHPVVTPEAARAAGYGLFTARYGNLYTTTQFVQLIERAHDRFRPAEPAWEAPDGWLVDPFRPTIQPGGYGSEAELGRAVAALRVVNRHARVLLTVSPVPLTATASGDHVLPATGYSKAALRVAAQEAADEMDGVWYFPSYEIVTGPQARGRFFRPNLREVTPDGVAAVMAIFLRAVAGIGPEPPEAARADPPPVPAADPIAGWVEAMCDEAMLDRPEGGR